MIESGYREWRKAEADCDQYAGDCQATFHIAEVFAQPDDDKGELYVVDDDGLAVLTERHGDVQRQYTNDNHAKGTT